MFESGVPTSRRPPYASPATDPRWSLAVAILGSSMAFIDGTVVNVALPVMQRDLGIDADLVQWIVEAYSLLLASLVLVGGALGDRLGRRRVFVAGAVLFAIASAGCGASPNAIALIVARAIQGVGAALLVPGSLALISSAYASDDARGAAIGTWSAFSAATTAIGPVAGGWVVTHASWRWLFFFNVPIALLVVGLSLRCVDESRDETAAPHLDVAGALLAAAGLGAIVFALIDSEQPGRSASVRTPALLLAGAITLVAFGVVEARRRAPMVPLSLFRSPTFAGTNLLTLLLYAALGAGFFFLPFDLIQVQRYSPAAAGAALLPLVFLLSVLSRSTGALAGRLGARTLLIIGPLAAGAGFVLLAIPSTGGPYYRTFLPGVAVLGLGLGITVAPLTAAVMGAVEPHHAGVASGINNAVARAAGLLAIAALGALMSARFNRALDRAIARHAWPADVALAVEAQRGKLGGAEFPETIEPGLREALRRAFDEAFVTGFRTLMLVCAALSALAALAAFVLVGGSPRRQEPGPRRPSPL